MRLFVALEIAPGAAGELDDVVTPLRPAWPDLRWTGRDAWHLTLAFLGEVDEVVAGRLPERMRRAAAHHHTLTLSLSGAGAFPVPARARVLWTGIQGDRRELAALAASVSAGARRAGVPLPSDGRRYQPHLTLARCRAPVDVGPLTEGMASFAGTPWEASEIYLIQSRPNGQPRYETLGTWPLRPPQRPQLGRTGETALPGTI